MSKCVPGQRHGQCFSVLALIETPKENVAVERPKNTQHEEESKVYNKTKRSGQTPVTIESKCENPGIRDTLELVTEEGIDGDVSRGWARWIKWRLPPPSLRPDPKSDTI